MLKSIGFFLILGTSLFILKSHFKPERQEQTIVISREKIREVREKSFSKNGKFEKGLFDSLIQVEITNEILFREALNLKINESDPTVRKWLVKNMRFMLKRDGSPEKDDDYYFKKALELGMDKEDLVVRRMLIQRVKSLLPFKNTLQEPNLEDIKNYQKENFSKFSSPSLIKFSQIFFKKSEKAKTLLSIKDIKKWKSESDDFHMGSSLTLSKKEIKKSLGKKFYRELSSLKEKKWSKPIASTFGYHLVRIEKVIPKRPHPLSLVKSRIRLLIIEERKKRALFEEIQNLRRYYNVVLKEV
tara:strand:+ start:1033 stop:1932 length:900 start_codon:yes stop_codon:yes gene_type:complete